MLKRGKKKGAITRMQRETIELEKLKEYKRNAKVHTRAQIQHIANSIQEFGFNDPIEIDENNMILSGHGRVEAAKLLGLTEVPFVRLEHLTEDEKKGYILAANATNMATGFDNEILNIELKDIEIDMTKFGLEFEPIEIELDNTNNEIDEDDKEHHRDTTIEQYNLFDYDDKRTEGFYQMPYIDGVDHEPTDLQGFNYVLNKPDYRKGVHFYLDDYQFERIWQRPEYYIDKLTNFDCVLTPDFSLYMDMPIAMMVWNVYRSRLIGQIMQDHGLTVIPTVSWAGKDSFNFCFDGLPSNSTLSISTIGVKRDSDAMAIWEAGVREMLNRLTPTRLIVYGGELEFDYGEGVEVIHISNAVTDRMKEGDKNGK
nr:MAG TPA: ParB protein [Caudoviricetes sp.]